MCSGSKDLGRSCWSDRSHAPRGNAAGTLRVPLERGASLEAFPRRPWKRSFRTPAQSALYSGSE
ncbi:hypothetical protein FQ192_30050 [Pseudomonas sp. ANT_J12]|nr:hypothetical protein FQ192_30050 [Pseudomonas sp. ANT_J12]